MVDTMPTARASLVSVSQVVVDAVPVGVVCVVTIGVLRSVAVAVDLDARRPGRAGRRADD
jgi:hypothetical protein